VDGNGLIANGPQGLGKGLGQTAGLVESVLTRSEGPVAGLSALKSNFSAQGGQPGGILGILHPDSVLNGITTTKLHEAKTALGKPGAVVKTDAVLNAAPDMDPANSALAAFAKMNVTISGKTISDFVATKLSATDSAKPAETALSTLSADNSLNISADKPQGFQSLLQSHPGDVKPGASPVSAVAVEIARKFSSGSNRFQIRLDPPELGRIDVRMDVNREGKISAHLIVEKPETLAALNRDAGSLERALNASGLETRENGLNFSLSGGNHSFEGNKKSTGFGENHEAGMAGTPEIEILGGDTTLRGYVSPGGVDIHV
jgi:hypothetical protein